MDNKELLDRYGPKEVRHLEPDRQLGQIRFSSCGELLFAGGLDGTVRRWRITSDDFVELAPITGHHGWVQAIAIGAGRLLFTADSWGKICAWSHSRQDVVPVWSVESAHNGWVRSMAVTPDGKRLVSCGLDRVVRIWSVAEGTGLAELAGHGEDVFCVAVHPDGRSVVSGDLKGIIKHWDLDSGDCMREMDARELFKLDRLQDVGGVRSMALNRDGTMLACGGMIPKVGANVQGNPTVLIFDWHTGMKKRLLSLGGEGDGFVYDLHFHRDGFLMAVTSGNPGSGKFLFIRPGDKEPFFATTRMPNCHSLAIDPSGSRVAVTATNGGSNGNGRQLKNGQYVGNWSPVHVWDLPAS